MGLACSGGETCALDTAGTRAAAEVSGFILAERHASDTEPEPRVTAEEWLAADEAARQDEDQHRAVTDHDLTDHDIAADTSDLDVRIDKKADPSDERGQRLLTDSTVDLREVAASETHRRGEDLVRVPSAAEVAESTRQANRAITEMNARKALDAQADDDRRAVELARWHTQDHVEAEVSDGVDSDAMVSDGYRAIDEGISR